MTDFGQVAQGMFEKTPMNTKFSQPKVHSNLKKWHTDKTDLTTDEIEAWIQKHQSEIVPELDDLWHYYKAENTTILGRSPTDPATPHNNTPIGYGRKIVTTFTGYAYRPHYITYKVGGAESSQQFVDELLTTFDYNAEHIKTSRSGRNTAIFGVAYELMYIEGVNTNNPIFPTRAEPRFVNADPRNIILLYDYSPETEKVIGIRYYQKSATKWRVELYLPNEVRVYERVKNEQLGGKWRYDQIGDYPNFYGAVPIVAYYMGEEMLGVIRPVRTLIDDYDLLVSDSIVEFDRFANAYLRLVGMTLGQDSTDNKKGLNRMIQVLKEKRIFNRLQDKDDVTFLTKDIPSEFIAFMSKLIRDEIHKQSHVPDFTELATGGDLSGAAIQRLMFDFENLVSSAEGDFDLGLEDRIRMIAHIYEIGRRGVPGGPEDVTIQHKRNVPLDTTEYAQTSVAMKQAGFSRYLIASIWPDDIIPDVDEEIARQDAEAQAMFADLDTMDIEDNAEPTEA